MCVCVCVCIKVVYLSYEKLGYEDHWIWVFEVVSKVYKIVRDRMNILIVCVQ